jgi:hypothetical protein
MQGGKQIKDKPKGKQIKGGDQNINNIATKAKFMKAGKSDKVGINESVKGYYSESTSIEEGLCE